MRYTNETLIQYCNENKIQLTNKSTSENINRESYIEGNCITENCCNKFNKCFRQLIKTGAYCDPCMQSISKNKIKNSKVKYDIHMLINFCNENNICKLGNNINCIDSFDCISNLENSCSYDSKSAVKLCHFSQEIDKSLDIKEKFISTKKKLIFELK